MLGSSWVAAQLTTSQEGLSSMSEWVTESSCSVSAISFCAVLRNNYMNMERRVSLCLQREGNQSQHLSVTQLSSHLPSYVAAKYRFHMWIVIINSESPPSGSSCMTNRMAVALCSFIGGYRCFRRTCLRPFYMPCQSPSRWKRYTCIPPKCNRSLPTDFILRRYHQ
jgi:hypothetical protein